jgi:acetyl esterase
MAWFIEQYARDADPQDPRLAPLRLPEKAELASATLITAECDPLRDEGAAYADALAAAGVNVAYRCYPGALHGFAGLPGFFDQAIETRAFVAEQLKAAFTG